MKGLLVALGIALGFSVGVGAPAAHAGPPTPPPTPICRWCGGPPPAPTPVPTLAPTMVVPDTHPVSVVITPTRVHRGGKTRISINASAQDRVTFTVRYYHARPVKYRTTVGRTGKLVKQWSVAKTAPVGKATVKIIIADDRRPYSGLVSFTVVK